MWGQAAFIYKDQPDLASAWALEPFKTLVQNGGLLALLAFMACVVYIFLAKMRF